jgi:hypothetical protein
MAVTSPTAGQLESLLGRVMARDDQIDPDAALTLYFFLPVTVKGIKFRSSLEALLRDARGAAGRDLENGRIVHPDMSRSWLAAIGYLSLVDQMSKLLDIPVDLGNPDVKAATSFERLLIWDGEVLADEAAALYALRCATVHSYGLLNDSRGRTRRNKNMTPEKLHRIEDRERSTLHMFELSAEGRDVVTLRNRLFPFLAALSDISPTSVDLRSMEDIVERLIGDLRSQHLAGQGLRIRSDVPLPTFVRACLFKYYDSVQPKEFAPGTAGASVPYLVHVDTSSPPASAFPEVT